MAEPVLQQARWQKLRLASAAVPAGRWAVGVSGGADSVALLRLLAERTDLQLHIVHLDHQTRGEESTGDAQFVHDLAQHLDLPVTIGLRSEIERTLAKIPANLPARFREARMELFKQVVITKELMGVILGHHADDQAETILHRLLRGAGAASLSAMSSRANIGGLRILRPLLAIRSGELREFLDEIAQPWREDSSNRSTRYLRNQLRMILTENAPLRESLLNLGKNCRHLRKWVAQNSPQLGERFPVEALALLPPPLARRSAGRWLAEQGSPIQQLSSVVCDRLILMATDAASPPRQHFPGALLVRRRQGIIFADRPDDTVNNPSKTP
jgi:tRNA(Ile)-lysidine synthetase-like protein